LSRTEGASVAQSIEDAPRVSTFGGYSFGRLTKGVDLPPIGVSVAHSIEDAPRVSTFGGYSEGA